MEELHCIVERITYQSPKNGYTVLRCRVNDQPELVTVVGTMPEVHVGSALALEGIWKMDARYGRQFSVRKFAQTIPATVTGIEKYLGSGLIKGIGKVFAKKIVEQFGENTLEILETDPDRLLEVPGVGKRRVEQMKKTWAEQREMKNIMLFLQSYDISATHAVKIFKTYGNDSIQVLQENPYRLADDIWGIGFKTADAIATKMGFEHDHFARLRSGLLYTLNRLADNGHCYGTAEQLLKEGAALLDVEPETLSSALSRMIDGADVHAENDAIYLTPFYYAETGAAKRLREIAGNNAGFPIETDGLLERIVRRTGIQYDDIQKQAILTAARSKIFILTGGPGTGKTTTTLGIITAFQEAGAKILLAAPTGRAAKRLSEATGLEAKTIHRLLEYRPPEGYQRGEGHPLERDVLILDECSMIDLLLLYGLLKAVPNRMIMVLVGDIDQLPSVGAGNVLRDLIESGRFPVVRLERIFRQAQSSRIVMNAHRINAGKFPDISNGRDSDFFFLERDEAEDALQTIVELVERKLPRYYHLPPVEIQVLSPMQRGVAGAGNLNLALQNAINPGELGLRRGGILFKSGDKVMQIRNNYDKEIFNGDIGIVAYVDMANETLTVRFDQRMIDYDITELDELVLAYATTIHKSQGSEYPVVVIPLLLNHYIMLQRNLLYTGITRAKRGLILVGSKKALGIAIRNVTVRQRNTCLKERLLFS